MLRNEGKLKVIFVTKNEHKFMEAKAIAESMGIVLIQSHIRKVEIQAFDLKEIAVFSSRYVRNELSSSTYIVEDAGLFVRRLNGFPGPYSSYVYKTIGCEGVLKLLEGIDDRRATFKSVVVLYDPRIGEVIFEGITEGTISYSIRGKGGFGFDPIFIPKMLKRTYAELTLAEKNEISHRAKAMKKTFGFIKYHLKTESN